MPITSEHSEPPIEHRAENTAVIDAAFDDAIVVPLAPGDTGDQLLVLVRDLAEAFDKPIEIVTVLRDRDDLVDEFESLVDVVTRMAELTVRPLRCRLVIDENPAQAVFDLCSDRLVCMTSSGNPFRHLDFVDSYAAGVLARSTEPVVLVGPCVPAGSGAAFAEILVAASDEPESLNVLEVARDAAARFAVPLTVAHVVLDHDPNIMIDGDGTARLWLSGDLHTTVAVEPISGADVATALAQRATGSLLAVSSHARCGLARLAEGSITFDALTAMETPVLAVGPNIGQNGSASSAPLRDGRALRCVGHRAEATQDVRAHFDGDVATTEVIYTPRGSLGVAASFVLVVDGSKRGAEAIAPAARLAALSRSALSVIVIAGEHERDGAMGSARSQLAERGLDDLAVEFVERSAAEAALLSAAMGGHTLVMGAFGTWELDGHMHGLLGLLLEQNIPAIVGVGPKVATAWDPAKPGPMIVCADESSASEELIAHLDSFIAPQATEVVLLHIDDPVAGGEGPAARAPDTTRWSTLAKAITDRWGIPASVVTQPTGSIPASIAAYASTVDASLILMASHHRPGPSRPTIASASLATVASAPCPVGIISRPDA